MACPQRRIGLDHLAIGVPSGEVSRLAKELDDAGVPNSGVKADPLGPAVITFRDPDNVQWEFFEQVTPRHRGSRRSGVIELVSPMTPPGRTREFI
jgi:hypothetical protein